MRSSFTEGFIKFSALMLLFTAIAKFISTTGSAKILSSPDPFFHINYQYLLTLAALLEFGISIVLLRAKSVSLRLGLICWTATLFGVYRLAIWKINPSASCGCLGTLTSSFGISQKEAELLTKSMFLILFFGGYSFAISHWLHNFKSNSTDRDKR